MTPREFNQSSDDALGRLRAKLTGVPYVKRQALTGYTTVNVHQFTSEDLPSALANMADFIKTEDEKTDLDRFQPRWEWHFTHEVDAGADSHVILLWQMG